MVIILSGLIGLEVSRVVADPVAVGYRLVGVTMAKHS